MEDYLAMARVGIATTRELLASKGTSPRCDVTPCHGLGGLIEILNMPSRTSTIHLFATRPWLRRMR